MFHFYMESVRQREPRTLASHLVFPSSFFFFSEESIDLFLEDLLHW